MSLAEYHFTTPTREGWSRRDRSPLIRFSGGLGRHHAHVSPVSSGRCRTRCARRPRCCYYRCQGDVPAALAPGACDVLAALAPDTLAPDALAPGALAPDTLALYAIAPAALLLYALSLYELALSVLVVFAVACQSCHHWVHYP
jgi:hypothetical protein